MLKLALLPWVTFHPTTFVYTSQISTSKFLLTFSSPCLECSSSHSPHQALNHHLKTSPSPTSPWKDCLTSPLSEKSQDTKSAKPPCIQSFPDLYDSLTFLRLNLLT